MKPLSRILLVYFLLGLSSCDQARKPTSSSKTFEMADNEDGQAQCSECDQKKYDLFRSEFQLIGAWFITDLSNSSTFELEIYHKGKEYVAIRKSEELIIETLTKEGDSYLIDGNPYGEFYHIDAAKKLMLFDKDSEHKSPNIKAELK